MHQLKPMLQLLVRPVARFIANIGGTANQVTTLAMLGSMMVGLVLYGIGGYIRLVWLLLPLWSCLRMALNALDGVLAREYGQQSRLGAYLNELSDVVSDAALIAPLATLPGFSPTLVVLITLLASWCELAGVLGASMGSGRRFEGPMGKADRALVLGLIGGWVGLFGSSPPFVLLIQLGMVALLIITILRRVGHGVTARGHR